MSLDVITLALSNKKIKSIASGISNITSSGDTIYFHCNDGNIIPVKVSSGVIDVNWIEADKLLKVSLADGTIKDIDLSTLTSTDTKEIDIPTASATWSLQHNLKTPWYKLTTTFIDSDDIITIGDVDVDNCTDNLIVVKFNKAISGKAIIKK